MCAEQLGMFIQESDQSAEFSGAIGNPPIPADRVEFTGLCIGNPAAIKPAQHSPSAVNNQQQVTAVQLPQRIAAGNEVMYSTDRSCFGFNHPKAFRNAAGRPPPLGNELDFLPG